MHVADVILNIGRPLTEAEARAEHLSTFLCDANGGNACSTCHSTCSGCADDVCNQCYAGAVALNVYCLCQNNGVFGICPTCSGTGKVAVEGVCVCGSDYVPQNPATSDCVSCFSGGSYCIDSTEAGVMGSEELLAFAVNLATLSSPIINESNGLICYGERLPANTCAFDIVGTVTRDPETGLHLDNVGQCYEMLQASWPWVQSKFNAIFGSFAKPDTATVAQGHMLKSVLEMWILQYGGDLTGDPKWPELVTIFNSGSALEWDKLLGWAGSTPEYIYKGTRHTFPADVAASLKVSDLGLALFNTFSTVCDSPSCGFQTECAMVKPDSNCAGNSTA